MKVLQVCAYAAPHEGNFMKSLFCLESKLAQQGIDTIYAFPESAQSIDWCIKLSTRKKVYFLPLAKARIKPRTYRIFTRIYHENPDLCVVHSHFELYDIPATIKAPKTVKVFWHLHDPIEIGNGIRKYLWKAQYGIFSKKATLLSVAEKYRNEVVALGFPDKQTYTILNGIDTNRIVPILEYAANPKYTFLTFGWDFYRKGDDLILDACKRLHQEGYQFRILLNGGNDTYIQLQKYLDNVIPSYLTFGEPVNNVNELFLDSSVFIQASRRETFSYAICEAAYAGLPVISSDIPGLEWTHKLPSVRHFENENVNELYQLMKEAIISSPVSAQQIEQSRKHILERYTIDSWANKILHFYGF